MPERDELIGGRYRLGPAIGQGGMGTVRRARDLRFDRDVAVKLLRTTDDPRQRERMRREARLLGAVQHPNLVAAYDTGIELADSGPMHWLAMELVRGPDLGVLLRQRGRLDSEDVRRILHDLAAALVALHAARVWHRDVKPANVLLTGTPGSGPWHAKLADLGIAVSEDTAALTTTGQVMGTAAYLSPEQVSGSEIDGASDVYSLGLIALEALTGEHAFPGSAIESATARLVRPPVIPERITGGWRMLLTAMTAVDPADRPTAEQVQLATEWPLPVVGAEFEPEALPFDHEGEPTVAAEIGAPTAVLPTVAEAPAPTAPARRRPIVPIAAAALVLGVLGGGLALVATTGAPAPAASTPAPHVTQAAARPSASAPATVTAAQHTATPRTTPAPARSRSRSRSSTRRRRPARSGRAPSRDTARGEATARIDPVRSQGARVSVAGWLMS